MTTAYDNRTLDAVLELRDRLTRSNEHGDDPFSLLDFALLEYELSRFGHEDADPLAAFSRAVASVRNQSGMTPWLFGGAAGLGWLAARIGASLGVDIGGMGVVDEVSNKTLIDVMSIADVDLPQGPLGFAVYGLAHPNAEAGEALVNQVLQLMDDESERDEYGVFWRLDDQGPRAHLRPETVGSRDLGVAHGQAGAVAILSSIVRAGVGATDHAVRLLRDSTDWLIAQRLDNGVSHFAHCAELRDETSRDAWCYGDPGTALVLYQAGAVLEDSWVLAVAREVAESVVTRDPESSTVIDASVCHGSSFLAFLAHRLRDCDPSIDADAFGEYWRDSAVAEIEAGPLTYPVSLTERTTRTNFLEGDVGVALALLATISPIPPVWTDLLLADFVPSATEFARAEATRSRTTFRVLQEVA